MSRRKLQAKLRASERYSFLRLRGVIDEDNTLMSLVPKLTGDVLVIDLADVDRINSCGVRDWVNWLQAVEERGMKVVLIRCSPAIVAQINMVTNFSGGAIVHSFYAPYYSPSIDREYSKMIETESLIGQNPVRAPSFRCSETGEPLEFDDIEESYFAFINAHVTDQIDANLKRLVDEVAPDLEAKIRALNEAGSAPLTGPLQSVGTMGGFTTPTPDQVVNPSLPPNYLDIDEELEEDEGLRPFERPIVEQLPADVPEAPGASHTLLVVFWASAVVVVGLLIYFAVSGV